MNAAIQKKLFPLPRIRETIEQLEKFISTTSSITGILLYSDWQSKPENMRNQTPLRGMAYQRLPFGVAFALDIFQSTMMDMLGNLDYVLFYIDDY